MNDFRITEADVGEKFRLRNGDVVTVTKIFNHGSFPVKGKMGQYWFLDGTYYEDVEGAYGLDIVERLPKGDKYIKCLECNDSGFSKLRVLPRKPCEICGGLNTSNGGDSFQEVDDFLFDDSPTSPTMTASDGKQYPVEWFYIPQGYREHLPPTGARILSRCDGDSDGDCYVFAEFHNVSNAKKYGHVWTLVASSPAVEKVEPQIWDEYFHDVDVFDLVRPDDGGQLAILPRDLPDMSDAIDALYAWKNHVLSKDEAEL